MCRYVSVTLSKYVNKLHSGSQKVSLGGFILTSLVLGDYFGRFVCQKSSRSWRSREETKRPKEEKCINQLSISGSSNPDCRRAWRPSGLHGGKKWLKKRFSSRISVKDPDSVQSCEGMNVFRQRPDAFAHSHVKQVSPQWRALSSPALIQWKCKC